MRFTRLFWRVILWFIIILYLSLRESDGLPSWHWPFYEHTDKVVHFIMYFVLYLVLWSAWSRFNETKVSMKVQGVFALLCVLIGVFMEFFQEWFTSSRQGSIMDALANSLGVLMALLLFNWLKKFSQKLPLLFKL